MPYPAKTSAEIILTAAIEYLEEYGEAALTMRELASRLGLSPHALYRYYPDRAGLEAAMAEEGFRRLRLALADAVDNVSGKKALRAGAAAYLAFAEAHPAWYSLMMRFDEPSPGPFASGHEMWSYVVGLVGSVVGAENAASAAVALWAFLHGFTLLERAAILSDEKPRSGFQAGLEALLAGLTPHSQQ
jgi:AcrR family transcriptional regulator